MFLKTHSVQLPISFILLEIYLRCKFCSLVPYNSPWVKKPNSLTERSLCTAVFMKSEMHIQETIFQSKLWSTNNIQLKFGETCWYKRYCQCQTKQSQVPLSKAIMLSIQKYYFFHTIPIQLLSDSVELTQVRLKDSNIMKISGQVKQREKNKTSIPAMRKA